MDLGLLCLFDGGAVIGIDARAATNDHNRLGQIKPPSGFWRDGLAGRDSFPAPLINRVAWIAGVRCSARNHAVFHTQPLG